MIWFVYILRSVKDGKFYIGYTSDLRKRIARHNAGGSTYTKYKGPFELVYSEEYTDRREAIRREYKIKSWKSGTEFKALLAQRAGGRAANCTRL